MFQATNIRMAARQASGIEPASGAATRITSSSASACTMPATGLVAPLFTLVMVRAMVPVAGMPPKKGVTKLAAPCAINSWLGSCRSPITPSATRAHSSDSMAPSSASVMVGISRKRADSQLKLGSWNAGSAAGMPPNLLPMVSTGSLNTPTTSVATTSATMEPGTVLSLPDNCTLGPRLGSQRCQPMTMASDTTATPTAHQFTVCRWPYSAPRMPKKSPGILGTVRPRKSFTCDSAISTAMPLVKPMITEMGMKRTSVPSLNSPIRNSSTPDMAVAMIRLPTP